MLRTTCFAPGGACILGIQYRAAERYLYANAASQIGHGYEVPGAVASVGTQVDALVANEYTCAEEPACGLQPTSLLK